MKIRQNAVRLALSATIGLVIHAWGEKPTVEEAQQVPGAHELAEDLAADSTRAISVTAPTRGPSAEGSAPTHKPFYLPLIPR